MAVSYAKFFAPTVLTTSLATIYTVPVSPSANLLRGARVRLTNTTTSAQTARLHAVPFASSAAVGNSFFYDITVPADNYIDVDVPIMAAGDFIQGLAGANTSINIQAISGAVFS